MQNIHSWFAQESQFRGFDGSLNQLAQPFGRRCVKMPGLRYALDLYPSRRGADVRIKPTARGEKHVGRHGIIVGKSVCSAEPVSTGTHQRREV